MSNQINMNTLENKGNWKSLKGQFKKKWAKLTDNDQQFVKGDEDELNGGFQKRTGEDRDALEKAIEKAHFDYSCKKP